MSAAIKADESLRRIPVVVLTTSRAEEDFLKVYGLNDNCFIIKPLGLEQFVNVVRSIEDFSESLVKLPQD